MCVTCGVQSKPTCESREILDEGEMYTAMDKLQIMQMVEKCRDQMFSEDVRRGIMRQKDADEMMTIIRLIITDYLVAAVEERTHAGKETKGKER